MAERRIVDETPHDPEPPATNILSQLIDSLLAIVHRINPHASDETVQEHVAKLEALKEQSSKAAARL